MGDQRRWTERLSRTALAFVMVLSCALGSAACDNSDSSDDGSGTPDSGGGGETCSLKLDYIGGNYHTPSNVVVFFSIRDCHGDPVSSLPAESFSLSEDGEPFSEYESNHVLLPEKMPYKTYVTLVLDVSGSIVNSGAVGELEKAVKTFNQSHVATRWTSIRLFDGNEDSLMVLDYTNDKDAIETAADSIAEVVAQRQADGLWDESTNLYGALYAAESDLETMLEVHGNSGEYWEGAVVLFTDGTDRAGRTSYETVLSAVENSSVYVYTIGLSGEVNDEVLSALGKDDYVSVDSVEELGGAFESISERLQSEANKFYLLSYCSPSRAGLHAVTIRATSGSLSGELTVEFWATDFTGNCKAEEGTL